MIGRILAFIVCALTVLVGAVGWFYLIVDLTEWLGG